MPPAPVEFFLTRSADAEWREVVRPWLQRANGRLERALVVAPGRGRLHALKLRCVSEGLPLLGVEFLTPRLARRKWETTVGGPGAPAAGTDGTQAVESTDQFLRRPPVGRELLLLGLKAQVAARIGALGPEDPARGLWKSLESDLERALDDFDDLLRGGFSAADFPLRELREVFGALEAWVDRLGCALAPVQAVRAGLTPVQPSGGDSRGEAGASEGAAGAGGGGGDAVEGGRLLLLAGGAENWSEFFSLAALARRVPALTVVASEPDFRGRSSPGEAWVTLWQALLGVEPRLVEGDAGGCAAAAEAWTGGGRGEAGAWSETVRLIAGRTRSEEMERVADAVEAALAEGGESVAVVFPGPSPSSSALAHGLEARGIVHTDLIGQTGWAPTELQARRALASFYAGGCRLEGLLALWPLLRALGFARVPLGEARDACERLFGETQDHAVAGAVDRLTGSEHAAWKEVGRVAGLLMPPWPDSLTLAEALGRFEAVCARFRLSPPPGWSALEGFSRREPAPLPAKAVLETLLDFHPEQAPVPAKAHTVFARVTLTTVRRAAGVAWSHAILVHANAGVWPARREPSCWLGDEDRRALNTRARFSLGLLTTEDAAAIERSLVAGIARNTRVRVVLSAALADEEDPEARLSPNTWYERLLWALGLHEGEGGPERALERLAAAAVADRDGHHRGAPGGDAEAVSLGNSAGNFFENSLGGSLADWLGVWRRRRDPEAPFDRFFLADPGGSLRPASLPARLIERSVADPAELWFDQLLRAWRVGWQPLRRSRALLLGRLAHQVVAGAVRGEPVGGVFVRLRDEPAARAALAGALAEGRARWPANRYWDSFHSELGSVTTALLGQVYRLEAGPFAAVECELPRGATVRLGSGGEPLAVFGRMDLVLLDRPQWAGARVAVVDFKTGGDELSARAMAARGASLQLGIYLAAVLSAGAADGRVWMIKPEGEPKGLGGDELPEALAALARLGRHLSSGTYGALTPDRTEFSHPFEWPLACAPVGEAVLQRKYAATFGGGPDHD